jgi:hypothetical protein
VSFGQVLIHGSAQMVSNFKDASFLCCSFFTQNLSFTVNLINQAYLGYILLGHGGIINGLSELPYELGRKNDVYAKRIKVFCFLLVNNYQFTGSIDFSRRFFSIKHFFSWDYLQV